MASPEEAGLEASFLSFQNELFSLYHMPCGFDKCLKAGLSADISFIKHYHRENKVIVVQMIELIFLMCPACDWHVMARLVLMKMLDYDHTLVLF